MLSRSVLFFGLLSATCFFTTAQRFSIGFKSGLLPFRLESLNKILVRFKKKNITYLRRHGTKSSWTKTSVLGEYCFSITSTKCSFRIKVEVSFHPTINKSQLFSSVIGEATQHHSTTWLSDNRQYAIIWVLFAKSAWDGYHLIQRG